MIKVRSTRTVCCRYAGIAAVAGLVGIWCSLPTTAGAQDPGTRESAVSVTASPDAPLAGSQPAEERKPPAAAKPGEPPAPQLGAGEKEADVKAAAPAATASNAPKDPGTYGLWVLLPVVVTILLVLFSRQVVPSLVVGILVGAYMMVPCLLPNDAYATTNSVVAGFRLTMERYVFGAITDPRHDYGNMKVMFFSLVIGFTVGVIGRSGGTEGIVRLIAGRATSPRRTALTAWVAALIVFFNNYADTMIVGPTMRAVFDRVKLSRAKLAYIIDTTAVSVASLAVVGTWIGAEIGLIQNALGHLTQSGVPGFLQDDQGQVISGMTAFLHSLPYRFYALLAIVFAFLVSFTGRDFGPMWQSERKVLSKLDPAPATPESDTREEPDRGSAWWLGFFPVAVLLVGTVAVLIVTGYSAAGGEAVLQLDMPWWQRAAAIAVKGDAYLAIFYGAVLSAFVAVILTILARACSTKEAVDAGLHGMAQMFPTVVLLILAWAMSSVVQDLGLGDVVVAHLQAQGFSAAWLPLAIFVSAAVISFATGTSLGTMGILFPVTVAIAVRLIGAMDQAEALTIFYASIGSVLTGAVFGAHCSPISDTTVLASVASGCRHEEHVWTQLPYAVVTAIVSAACGNVLCGVYKQPWYYAWGGGTIVLILIVYVVGRKPRPSFELADL